VIKLKICLPGTKDEFSGPHGSGVYRVMYELYKNLQEVKTKNQIIEKVEFKELPFLYQGFSPYAGSIFYDFSKYDIIHNLAPRPLALIRRGKAITLATAHDFRMYIAPDIRPEDSMNLKRILGSYFVLKKGIKFELNCDYLCASSTQTRDEAIKLGFDKDKIFVVNLGVDKRFIGKPHKKAKGKNFKVGYIGALASTKNIDFAIKAFNILDNFNGTLEIWGRSLSNDYYNHLLEMSRTNKRIVFRGFAPEDKLVSIYDSFDVFVYPSLYEGFGLNIMEAQAKGIPVILLKHAKIPKEVKKYCYLAEDEGDMARIIEELYTKGYSEHHKKEAMAYASKFTWEDTAKNTLKLYSRLLDEK
jgi:glycosyltransferase involved in cell wall biosynthesis